MCILPGTFWYGLRYETGSSPNQLCINFTGMIMRIAIMQPYFIPYAGYFRLFYAADLFVVFDCVQFLRRGWMHRNRLPNVNNELQWITLPLQKAPQTILLKDLIFAENSEALWAKRLLSFPQLSAQCLKENRLLQYIKQLTQSPIEFIVSSLKITCDMLNLPFNVVRSSSLNLPATLKGEEKIIEIAKHFGANEYVNLAGGRELYQHNRFAQHGLKLRFLSDYQGPYESILQRLINEETGNLRDDIIEQTRMDE